MSAPATVEKENLANYCFLRLFHTMNSMYNTRGSHTFELRSEARG